MEKDTNDYMEYSLKNGKAKLENELQSSKVLVAIATPNSEISDRNFLLITSTFFFHKIKF